MIKILFLLSFVVSLASCASMGEHQPTESRDSRMSKADARGNKSEARSTKAEASAKKTHEPEMDQVILVEPADLKRLDHIATAMEEYVVSGADRNLKALCRDIRFDCFVDDRIFPSGKKSVIRSIPPYSSGSKMGLRGEKRVSVRFDFYPQKPKSAKMKNRKK